MSAEITTTDRFFAALTALTATRIVTPLTDAQRAMLSQDLPRAEVKVREQSGQKLSYVDGAYVIERLNAVFGFDGWTSVYGAPTIIQGERPVVYVQVTLRAMGVERGDVGVGLASRNTGDALETAIKAAFTDALKRAARTLGASLGLALYDKEQATVGYAFATQDIITAFDGARDLEAHKAAEEKARAIYATLPPDEKSAIAAAQLRSAKRAEGGAPKATGFSAPTQAANQSTPAPKPSPADAAREAIAAFEAATTRAELDAATAKHGPQLAKLPETDPKRAEAKTLLSTRRAQFLTASMVERATRAKSGEDLSLLNTDLQDACAKRLLSRAQAEEIVAAMNTTVAMLHEAA